MTVYRNWPVVGALVAMIAMVGVGSILSEPLAVAIAVAVYVLGFVVLGKLSRTLRARCRTVEASFLVECDGAMSAGNPALLSATLRSFNDLELAHRAGRTSVAQFEARWADVYNSLARTALPTSTER